MIGGGAIGSEEFGFGENLDFLGFAKGEVS